MLQRLIPYQDQEILKLGTRPDDKLWNEAYYLAVRSFERRVFNALSACGFASALNINGNKITLSVIKRGARQVIIRAQVCNVEDLLKIVKEHPDL